MWRECVLTGEAGNHGKMRHFFRHIPASPRCQICNAPFEGLGGRLVKTFMKIRRSERNPKFCALCFTPEDGDVGAEIEMSLLFADVRGSTQIAERSSPVDFSRLMNRFYNVANKVLVEYDAFIDKMMGDEVIGLFIPGWAGPGHSEKAIHAARQLLEATGNVAGRTPLVPVGVGVHTGVAYFGSVGSIDTFADITALGDAVNVTSRLASAAGPGELLISDAAAKAGRLDTAQCQLRELELKGRAEPVRVYAQCFSSSGN